MLKSPVEQIVNSPRKRTLSPIVLLSLILVFTALACDLSDLTGGGKPNAIITSPPSGSTYHEGEDVAVQSVSTDSGGILRVELLVDGQVVRTDTAPSPQNQFTLVQTWKATQGSHTLLVRAYNTQNAGSDPAAISISVSPSIAGGPTVPPTSAPGVPTLTPAPGIPSITPAPGVCTNNSAFVVDVTIPDGAAVNAGQAFNKIWRLSNNGTCAWSVGYQFVFVSGEAMTANTVISVPSTAPGATADLLVPMTAPGGAGSHTGSWRLRSAGAVLFGATVSVKITVPGAPSTPTTVPGGCTGNPVIASFSASPNPITAGQSTTLNWGAVTNADSVEINQGIGGVGAPGSTTVAPGSTTTYTMTAHCGGNVATSSVTITISGAAPGNFAGHWVHNFGTMDLTQSGATVTGTYHNSFDGGNGTVAGIVTGNTLNGTYQKVQSHPIVFTLGAGGNTFDGNWAGTNQWCGARSGVAFPAGCGYSGNWTTFVTGNHNCAMTLTQVDTTVTGHYCNIAGNTMSGTVTYSTSPDEAILTGTYSSGSGPFKFYLFSYNGEYFQGNWATTNPWCGERSGASEPSPCLK